MNQGINHRRVVITGLGAITPLGNSVAQTWEAAIAGKSGVGPITRFDASAFNSRIAAEVRGFKAEDYLETKEIKKQDLFSQYAVASSLEAWADAKLEESGMDRRRIGCMLGVGIGGLTTLERYHQAYLEGGPRKISPFLIPGMISNLGPGNVAIRLGLKGVNFTVTSACTSATHAIGESYLAIKHGRCDAMVTGGSESAVTPIGIGGFCALKALSTRNDQPERASRPFDKERDGFVLGEGACCLVLEEYESARRRGAKIYAEVLGYGASCDAFHITAPSEDGAGAVACMREALAEANLRPEDVQYVNAHGTSTPANDSTETAAIKTVFGDWAKSGLLVSSTKSMTGHLLGAAGAIEALFSALCVRDGIVPPTINLENPDPECDLNYVPGQAQKVAVRVAVSNSFGFGGTNGTLVIGKYTG
jgi:3-oxoacyl-[acyl-carrier-protein] synthase II